MTAKAKTLLVVGYGGDSIFEFDRYEKYGLAIIPWRDGDKIQQVLDDDNLGGILFTGGEDVHPTLYNQTNTKSYPNLHRDLMEKYIFDHAFAQGIPMIGICRGAQLMNVLMGGSMIQHIDGHAGHGQHNIVTSDGRRVAVNSIHHQAIVPAEKMEVIARSDDGIVEAIINKEHRMLGVQFHPEMMSPNHPGSMYFQSLIEQYDIV